MKINILQTKTPLLVTSLLTIAFAVWTAYNGHVANKYTKNQIDLQKTPFLSAEIRPERVHVGPVNGRIDEVVTIPVTIHNNGKPTAYKVEVDVVILVDSKQSSEGVSINSYLREINAPIVGRETLAGNATWNLSPMGPSVVGNAFEIYKSGKTECKIKILLSWQDSEGKEFKWATLAKLQYKPRIEVFSDSFWWEVMDTLTSWQNPEKIKKHWGLKFTF